MPFDLVYLRLSGKYGLPIADDLEMDGPLTRIVFGKSHDNPWTDSARARVDFCLREIEHVLAFDIARAHVVSNREANNFSGTVDDQRQLGLRYIPAGIFADSDRVGWRNDFFRKRLEEDLRTH